MDELKRSAVLLEICVASPDDAQAADDGGADRIELNAALALGGLTPSLGTLLEVKRIVSVPVLVMVRPRSGGFAYSEAEFHVLQRDVELVLHHGADGIVFGILNQDGTVDRERCRKVVQQADGRPTVFHRAFDVTPDPFAALEQLVDLGITRILTSGQEQTAYYGAALIAKLRERADGRIEILPGGGINRFTVADVLVRTGCNQVHASLRSDRADPSTSARPGLSFGTSICLPEDRYTTTDPTAVAEIKTLLAKAVPITH